MKSIVIIKLGGSVITDKFQPYKARPEVIRKLAKEIKRAGCPVLILHGSGSFGHTSALKYGGKKGYKSILGISRVSYDAMSINKIVMDALVEEKLPVISLRPMSLFVTSEGKIKKRNFEPIKLSLSQELIPVLYGDVIWDEKWKSTIYSGEKLAFEISRFLTKNNYKIKFIVQVGSTDGVLSQGKTIPMINARYYPEIKKNIFNSKNTDVTGGMKHKIEESLKLSKMGIKTYIINGNKRNSLYDILVNKKSSGTLIR